LFAVPETAKYPMTFEKADLNPGKIIKEIITIPKMKNQGITVSKNAAPKFCVILPPHVLTNTDELIRI
jgi:hypothetical protein